MDTRKLKLLRFGDFNILIYLKTIFWRSKTKDCNFHKFQTSEVLIDLKVYNFLKTKDLEV